MRQSTKGKREVHPLADKLPMLGQDRMEDLAANIKQNGLFHPVVLDKEGRVIDGRNRLEACKLAEVTPMFETYEGDNVEQYIVAANERRDISKGQRAMFAVVAAEDFLKKSSRGNTKALAKGSDLSSKLISQALLVKEHANDLVDRVLAGESLNDAYIIAQDIKKAKEDKKAADEQTMALLRGAYPDMLAHVEAGEWTVEQAGREIKAQQEMAKLEQEVQLAMETIGDEVAIPPKPEPDEAEPLEGEQVGDETPGLNTEKLKAMHELLGSINYLGRSLEQMAKAPPISDGWAMAGYREAIHAGVTQIVAAAYAIDQAHIEAARDLRQLYSVK